MQIRNSGLFIGRAAVFALFLAASCVAQTSPGGQTSPSGQMPQSGQMPPSAQTPSTGPTAPGAVARQASGSKTIIGCLQRGDSGFVIKSSDGTYELNTDRDLTAYVGKQVKLSGSWTATGVFSTAPVSGPSTSSSAGPSTTTPPAAAESSTGTPAFVGDLHLQIVGTVIGDCAAPPK